MMAEETSRNKVNIGISSLILIFIVLCLSTFGLLSLSSAKGDLNLAKRGAAAVSRYYEADSKGARWLADVDAVLIEEMQGHTDASQYSQRIKKRLGDAYDSETGLISTDISMEQGQSLHIDLSLAEGGRRYAVRAWYVYDSGQLAIDNAMPVWDGGNISQED